MAGLCCNVYCLLLSSTLINAAFVVLIVVQPFIQLGIVVWPVMVVLGHLTFVCGKTLDMPALAKYGRWTCLINVFMLLGLNSTICLMSMPRFKEIASRLMLRQENQPYDLDSTITAVLVFNVSVVLVFFYVFIYIALGFGDTQGNDDLSMTKTASKSHVVESWSTHFHNLCKLHSSEGRNRDNLKDILVMTSNPHSVVSDHRSVDSPQPTSTVCEPPWV